MWRCVLRIIAWIWWFLVLLKIKGHLLLSRLDRCLVLNFRSCLFANVACLFCLLLVVYLSPKKKKEQWPSFSDQVCYLKTIILFQSFNNPPWNCLPVGILFSIFFTEPVFSGRPTYCCLLFFVGAHAQVFSCLQLCTCSTSNYHGQPGEWMRHLPLCTV